MYRVEKTQSKRKEIETLKSLSFKWTPNIIGISREFIILQQADQIFHHRNILWKCKWKLYFLHVLGIIIVHKVLAHDFIANGWGPHTNPVGETTRGATPQCYPSIWSVSDICQREPHCQLHHTLLFSAGEKIQLTDYFLQNTENWDLPF